RRDCSRHVAARICRHSEGRSSSTAEPLAAESPWCRSVTELLLVGAFDGILVVVSRVELLLRHRCDTIFEEEPRQTCAQLLHLRDLALGVRLRRNVLRRFERSDLPQLVRRQSLMALEELTVGQTDDVSRLPSVQCDLP